MNNNITAYVAELDRQYQTNVAGEHAHRPALKQLLTVMLPHLTVTNEPARSECGAPDYILLRKNDNIPVAYVEAKDINDTDLEGRKKNKEQFDRYKKALNHILFTDYLEFLRYEKECGEVVERIRIAELKDGKIRPIKENFAKFESIVKKFGEAPPQPIDSSTKLAEVMAGKANKMAEVIEKVLTNGNGNTNGPLAGLMADFKEMLLHDITPKEFADAYAQTIAYGMFAARLHVTAPKHFNREGAAKLIPKTNPFLRQLFNQITGLDIDDRIGWIVDDLAEIFRVANMQAVMKDFGERTQKSDPMIHFYEDFLIAYDPLERYERGVWYTPRPIVNFIVRAVDEILQQEFGILEGLADRSKVKAKSFNQETGKTNPTESEVHKVQILDPALGTGAFLVETVRLIHEKVQSGMWQGYVQEHLIPRLNGFEVLMAAYTMAHINLDWQLKQTGYHAESNKRFRVFLTNSLQEPPADDQKLLFYFLAQEADGANQVKGNTPVMVVMGNPPYKGVTANKGLGNIDMYKYVDDVHFDERKHWLNDDYVKFIRLGQEFIDDNGEGILAYINNHSFIDNPTFRGMRWNLLRSFDKIYVIDLHGNSKKKEVCPDGSKDENVFNIQQGVSINIFVKTGRKSKNAFARVYHYDLYGRRKEKFEYIQKHKFSKIPFDRVKPTAPFFFLKPKNEANLKEYEQGFRVDELFAVSSVGCVTANDVLNISFTVNEQKKKIDDLLKMPEHEWREKYGRMKDAQDWTYRTAKSDAQSKNAKITTIAYRPFDLRKTYYTGKSKGLYARPLYAVMQHFVNGENIGLIFKRGFTEIAPPAFVSNHIIDFRLWSRPGMQGGDYIAPLYLYPNADELLENGIRKPNLDKDIIDTISQRTGSTFVKEQTKKRNTFAPIDVLDYIYAVLHSPTYRERYKEFLKVDFPRVPYPENAEQFRKLAKLGEKLRCLHLMEGVKPPQRLAHYDICGNDTVERIEYVNGKVWINETQFFDRVPLDAWNFYIGGYQPAQKWLKDRKGRTLCTDDIEHYQKIIYILNETITVMREIDEL